jgi:cytochrome c oxidase subunit 3
LVSGLTYFDLKIGLFFTIFLAILFTIFQIYEYRFANFSLMDGIYGSTFFIATGFHGFHVLIGTIFIIIAFLRTNKGHFSRKRHFGFEAAA